MAYHMTIQDEVLVYIDQHGMKKKCFASMIDVSPQMLSYWLSGRVQFKRNTLDKIFSIIRAN